MAAVAEQHLTLEEFRARYGEGKKPYFEYWNGAPIQKSVPAKLHSKLQSLIVVMLKELGYFAYVEVALRIDPNWEPIPDVIAELAPSLEPYPTKPVDIVVEILSPGDDFSVVQDKCERYSATGIKDILVLDPIRHKSWAWHSQMKCLVPAGPEYTFYSARLLVFENVWTRLEQEQ